MVSCCMRHLPVSWEIRQKSRNGELMEIQAGGLRTGGRTCWYLLSWENGEKWKKDDSHGSHPGVAACSLLPREVRHSLGNGAMEKGAFRKRPFFYIW